MTAHKAGGSSAGDLPHLTVARGVSEAALTDIQTLAAQVTIGWTVDQLVLMRSHTDPKGSIYEPLFTTELVLEPV